MKRKNILIWIAFLSLMIPMQSQAKPLDPVRPDGEDRQEFRLPGGSLPEAGTLSFSVQFDRNLYPSVLPGREKKEWVVPLIRTPLFNARLVAKPSALLMDIELERVEEKGPLDRGLTRTMLNHLKGGQWYHMAYSWDIAANRFDFYLNGTLQEHISNILIPYWEDGRPDLDGPIFLGGRNSASGLSVEFKDLTLTDQVGQGETLPEEVAAAAGAVPPLAGEGRTLYDGPLDLSAYPGKTLIYEADFSGPLDVVDENDLFDGDVRTREPDADWVLEATGTAYTENGALVLESEEEVELQRWENGAPVWEPGLRARHVVLWLNRRMPDGILVEYTMEPVDSRQGLHILFFGARAADGGSIFHHGLSPRGGGFAKYIFNPEEILSYHISWWSSPQTADRRSSNLRKNNGFYLLTAGDDRINRRGERPYRIRLLKDGGKIRGEVDGRKVIHYDDEGDVFGPVFTDGYLGFRMMGQSKKIFIRELKVWKLEKPKQ